jgi:hypothetical protein
MEPGKLSCPHCGSENTSSLPLVYQRSHATGTAVHRGVVGYDVEITTTTYSDGSSSSKETGRTPVYGNIVHDTYTETDLAKEIAPPQAPQLKQESYDTWTTGCVGCGCVMPLVIFFLVLFIEYAVHVHLSNRDQQVIMALGVITLAAYLVYARIGTRRRNIAAKKEYDAGMQEYHRKMEIWQKLYICNRCGHRFVVDE